MPHRLRSVARSLRSEATRAERRLWQGLRRSQAADFRFRRQVILGDFIVDFASFDARLVIEGDGATHSTNEEVAGDASRPSLIAQQEYSILRFASDEVFRNLDGVLETIYAKLLELRPRVEEQTT